MSRLIDANEVLKSCVDEKGNYLGHDAAVVGEAVSAAPTVDAVPVVRAKWEWNDHNGYYYCEKCGGISPRENQDGEYCDCPPFCPYCGAKMEAV